MRLFIYYKILKVFYEVMRSLISIIYIYICIYIYVSDGNP
jgi:hypothetical protein